MLKHNRQKPIREFIDVRRGAQPILFFFLCGGVQNVQFEVDFWGQEVERFLEGGEAICEDAVEIGEGGCDAGAFGEGLEVLECALCMG